MHNINPQRYKNGDILYKLRLNNKNNFSIGGLFMKRSFAVILLTSLLTTNIIMVNAQTRDGELEKSYNEIIEYFENSNLPVNITYDTFEDEYYGNAYSNPEEYLHSYKDLISVEPIDEEDCQLYSSPDEKWYYNTGTSLPQVPNYSRYNLLSTVKKGDIIYEANGGGGFTGHIAIVEGVYFNTFYGVKYIRLIEAIQPGVRRSVLDDERVVDKGVTILRTNASSRVINKVVNFCIKQLGKDYAYDAAKNTSENEKTWYCSELIWAAYKNQGIDLETTGWPNEPGVTPRDILNGNNTSVINYN